MIEFSGIVSEKCNMDRRNRARKYTLILFSICLVFSIIFTVIFGILHDDEFKSMLICTIGMGVEIVLLALPLTKKRLEQIKKFTAIETRIIIENGMISFHNLICDRPKPISKVKKVIDMGDWYYIIFKFGDISNSWICQKDLIKKGTIEEFEKLFEDKIIRENKKNA